MSEVYGTCEHCGMKLDKLNCCEAACDPCMEWESNWTVSVRERLEEVEAFLLDPDDITLNNLRDFAADRLRRELRKEGEKDIDEAILTGSTEEGTITELKESARETALLERAELHDRLREIEQKTRKLAAAG